MYIMDFYDVTLVQDLQIPVYESDPPSQSLSSPGLLWYNTAVGALRFTYNTTGSDATYCIKTVCCVR